MIPLLICTVAVLSSVAEARVTFTHSEVLQETDVIIGTRAPFKCDNGCQAYTNSRSTQIFIIAYNEITKQYDDIVSFNGTGGAIFPLPDPYKLPASNNYFVENRGETKPSFVFYVVDNNAPNIDTPVLIPYDDYGIDANLDTRMFTVLSSKFDSVRYSQIEGAFQPGFPVIYATGFDAIAEEKCRPLYQSRSQESASVAAISVFAPISTMDYGYVGEHTALVKWNQKGLISNNARSSSVYSSPGYVGCTYTDQSYASSSNSVEAKFTLQASSLDVSAVYQSVAVEETVHFNVDTINLDFNGTDSFSKQYPVAESFAIGISWKRTTPKSSWAIQLDFGTGESSAITSTTKDGVTVSSTAPSIDSTTSEARSFAIFGSIMVSIVALWSYNG